MASRILKGPSNFLLNFFKGQVKARFFIKRKTKSLGQ
jgi:hypothetical protein